jgi:uncharacterized membrane protein YhaH (DUF805 family)
MFKNPFSFEGRIRRTEFGISFLIAWLLSSFVITFANEYPILYIFCIPILLFWWAQGAKRCHDIDKIGWYQLIPFFPLILIFEEGNLNTNKYGPNPKKSNNNIVSSNQPISFTNNVIPPINKTEDYQGGYSGGHNSPNSSNVKNANQYGSTNESNSTEYKSGDLYN